MGGLPSRVLAAVLLACGCGPPPAPRAPGAVREADLGSPCASAKGCGERLTCIAGLCTRRLEAGPGEPCGDRSDCAGEKPCILGTCRVSPSAPGSDCSTFEDCDPGSTGVLCFDGRCTPLGDGSPGAFCELDEHCRSPLACSGFSCTDPEKARPRTGEDGDECLTFAACLSGFCVLGQCAPEPLGSGSGCKAGSDCSSGICLADACRDSYLAPGEACAHDSECDDPVCIDGICAAGPSEAGGTCDSDSDCRLPAACIASRCRSSLAAKHEACTINDDCKSGLACIGGACG